MSRPDLELYLSGELVGHLVDVGGPMALRYLSEPTPVVSAALPWRPELYPASYASTRAVIEGWLPEDRMRIAIARQLGVDPLDSYALLAALGADCAGAVQIMLPGDKRPAPWVKWLSDDELVLTIENLPRSPLGFGGAIDVRSSLAGAQGKLAVVTQGSRIGLPQDGEPSTHIFKPQWVAGPEEAQLQDLVSNEAFCMRFARALGLSVANVFAKFIGDRPVLCVERYDREIIDGKLTRIHQEDLAQICGVIPTSKYQEDGGISLRQMVEGFVKAGVSRADATRDMLTAITVAAMIGNADQHAKNVSVLYSRGGSKMAPLYDLTSTMIYEDISRRSAFTVGEEIYIDEIDDQACIAEAVKWEMPEHIARQILTELVNRKNNAVNEALSDAHKEGWQTSAVERIAELVLSWPQRCREI